VCVVKEVKKLLVGWSMGCAAWEWKRMGPLGVVSRAVVYPGEGGRGKGE
jgi:hypothetical protein